MKSPAFEIVRLEAGWASLRFSDGPTPVDVSASYLSDSLTDSARAVSALTRGSDSAVVRFQDEPGEVRVRMSLDGETIGLEFLSFDRTFDRNRDGEGHPGASLTVARRPFLRSVAFAFRTQLAADGVEGYKSRWRHPPPLIALADIERALGLEGVVYW